MDEPPLLAGAVNAMAAWVSPAVAVPIVGALGTTAATVNVCETWGAAFQAVLPDWFAWIVHTPAVTKVSTPPVLIVHTPVVVEVNVTAGRNWRWPRAWGRCRSSACRGC